MSNKKFLAVHNIAKRLNCSTSKVYELLNSGELPAFRLGKKGHFRVSEEDFNSFILEQKNDNQDYNDLI